MQQFSQEKIQFSFSFVAVSSAVSESWRAWDYLCVVKVAIEVLSAARLWRGAETKSASGRREEAAKENTRFATSSHAHAETRYCLVLGDVSASNRVVCACALRGVVRVQATCFWPSRLRAQPSPLRARRRFSLSSSPSHPRLFISLSSFSLFPVWLTHYVLGQCAWMVGRDVVRSFWGVELHVTPCSNDRFQWRSRI